MIYTADGTARFGLPAGEYTLYAGRGFEYGIDSVRVSLKPGDTARKELTIRREVPTPGYVACDTHVHTLTHSGHGDATDVERAITLAGEGIELPIATDHNMQVDYHAAAVKAGRAEVLHPGRRQRGDHRRRALQRLPAAGRRAGARLQGRRTGRASPPRSAGRRAAGRDPEPPARPARRVPPVRPGAAPRA